MSTFHKLNIEKIIKETADAVSILFTVPAELKEAYTFIAGQYVTIKASINGQEIRRAYSICASPKSNQIKVAVKAVEKGLFSTYATTQLKENTVLEVSEPEGKFVLEPKAAKNYLAFAAGSGITPVLSMIKAVLEKEVSSTFTLVFGNKKAESTIFYDELNGLSEAYPKQFNLHYIFSKEAVSNSKFGRIDKGHVNYFVKNIHKAISFDATYICGPEEMINLVSETLQEANFDKENIHFELFTASATATEIPAASSDGKSEITVLLDDEETTFSMDKTDTLLAASLRNKLDAPYSCQGGVCSSCIAKVTQGKAVMSKNSILSDDELEDGFVLTCVAHPCTPKLVLDFDDI
ncbi:ferredoxin--NADP reductase [Tenacibaculum finnmarkense]|uniref:ferredoxin--NADP reductase n=1 Tax=Tenacibaculum finnmarkense TaxID=2781243 RepID=UPI001EFAA363|nr:ferredoxin--NADP reductase [Tenacibaculum finnmarkense]MCG8205878.1 ferredoxin--NADP reductase [Tenacibaculum finnmarkense genomovar finnmarkense]MCG8722051.1 ferredoxin--NADP reductase [Tenacibaculum finnmarkense]MCG8740261.1 ferredoxin--NADP reductase [Tenacibaculum finnmarkense]MCG8763595.1 ferredoxin--NADP reductase [Tenacibaculum finnmarkense]MCG8776828.1 ferredoxin--NADP reductase [Tenacibaculum finnmarkense]